ncbi:hypothetical protein PENANT_c167G07855, partial [Penicillium antarcticum]
MAAHGVYHLNSDYLHSGTKHSSQSSFFLSAQLPFAHCQLSLALTPTISNLTKKLPGSSPPIDVEKPYSSVLISASNQASFTIPQEARLPITGGPQLSSKIELVASLMY